MSAWAAGEQAQLSQLAARLRDQLRVAEQAFHRLATHPDTARLSDDLAPFLDDIQETFGSMGALVGALTKNATAVDTPMAAAFLCVDLIGTGAGLRAMELLEEDPAAQAGSPLRPTLDAATKEARAAMQLVFALRDLVWRARDRPHTGAASDSPTS